MRGRCLRPFDVPASLRYQPLMHRLRARHLPARFAMPSVALLVGFALGLSTYACSRTGRPTASSSTGRTTSVSSTPPPTATVSSQVVDQDIDSGDSGRSHYDADDRNSLALGHAAGTGERRAIVKLIERYYAIAAAGDGGEACRLLYAPLARSLPQSVGQAGPAYMHGLTTCAAILTRLFQRDRSRLAGYDSNIAAALVRLSSQTGLVILVLRNAPPRQIEIAREGQSWKPYAPLDNELP